MCLSLTFSEIRVHTHTHTHKHTHTSSHINTHIRTHTNTHILSLIQTPTQPFPPRSYYLSASIILLNVVVAVLLDGMHAHARMHTHTPIHTHTHAHTHTHTHTHVRTHTHIYAHIHAHTHMLNMVDATRRFAHTYTRAHTHTHAHVHTHSSRIFQRNSRKRMAQNSWLTCCARRNWATNRWRGKIRSDTLLDASILSRNSYLPLTSLSVLQCIAVCCTLCCSALHYWMH